MPGIELEGCPDKEIAKLEAAHGTSLPQWYRLYLETMGRSVGVVRYFGDVDLHPKTLLKWMKRFKWQSSRYLIVGIAQWDSECHTFVDLGEDGQGVDVVSFEYPPGPSDADDVFAVATRFSTFIFSVLALRTLTQMPAVGSLGARNLETGKLPALGRVLRRSGLEEHPLSGTWDKLFVGPRCIVHGYETGGEDSLSVTLGCMAVEEWWEIAGRLEHELKLKISESPG